MLQKLLIANRGEIACRIIRTAKRLGIATVAVYSEADARALHVERADEAYAIGAAPARESYLAIERLIEVARRAGAQAVHPGYGFLAENPQFAEACAAAGLIFVGPSAAAMRAMGSKARAKALMAQARVPIAPGYHGDDQSPAAFATEAARVGYPVLVKASGGGGGRGLRMVQAPEELADAIVAAAREAQASFGDSRLLLEKYLDRARHIEIQIFADARGGCVAFPERDCSMQRRCQKILEESPGCALSAALRGTMQNAAVAAAKAVGYVGAGTIEFLVRDEDCYFLEMNARLQVEHPVTEMVMRLDLVEWQLRVACGEPLPVKKERLRPLGCAIEVRVCAEDPSRDFLPATGVIAHFAPPGESDAIRVDTGVRTGDAVTPYYDSLLAKLVAWGEDRAAALRRLRRALDDFEIAGVASNLDFLRALVADVRFEGGDYDTQFVARNAESLRRIDASEAEEAFALAAGAAAWLSELRRAEEARAAARGDPWSPWAACDAWRFEGPARSEVVFGLNDRSLRLHVTPIDRVSFRLESLSARANVEAQDRDGRLQLWVDGAKREAGIVRRKDGFTVILGGRNHALTLADQAAASDRPASDDRHLRAPLPARVARVLARVGASVKKDATLVVLEAMKTEFSLAAPRDGKVESVTCREGEFVAEGALLASLREGDG